MLLLFADVAVRAALLTNLLSVRSCCLMEAHQQMINKTPPEMKFNWFLLWWSSCWPVFVCVPMCVFACVCAARSFTPKARCYFESLRFSFVFIFHSAFLLLFNLLKKLVGNPQLCVVYFLMRRLSSFEWDLKWMNLLISLKQFLTIWIKFYCMQNRDAKINSYQRHRDVNRRSSCSTIW